jgi:hypothetical protein
MQEERWRRRRQISVPKMVEELALCVPLAGARLGVEANRHVKGRAQI